MFEVLRNEKERTADRMDAGKWLADRGFGKAALVVDVGLTEDALLDLYKGYSIEDLETMRAILLKYVGEEAESALQGASARRKFGRARDVSLVADDPARRSVLKSVAVAFSGVKPPMRNRRAK